jgi:hypothetical protein
MNDHYPTEASRSRISVSPESHESAPQLFGHGLSNDKSVQVKIGEDGLVELVEIDPRALRRGSEVLAKVAQEAMRNAQEDWFHRRFQVTVLERAERASTTKDRLQQKLGEIDARFAQRMQEIHEALDALSKYR